MDASEREFGVSVVICCYNSRQRLPATLEHLAEQNNPMAVPWEVLIVDNASTDDTGCWAPKFWPAHAQAPLRVVLEPKRGLAHARVRGMQASRYALISFIDDDNWVNEHWITTLARIFRTHPDIGICGAHPSPAPEGALPCWFGKYAHAYAAAMSEKDHGDVSARPLAVKGAGLTLHYRVWHRLSLAGFSFHTQGRNGTSLNSGEDCELAFAAAIAGFRLWNDASLTFRHFLPQERLRWHYLERLYHGFGKSSIVMDAYQHALLMGEASSPPSYFKKLYRIVTSLLRLPLIRLMMRNREGSHDRIRFAFRLGRLIAFLWLGRSYYALYDHVGQMAEGLAKQKISRTGKSQASKLAAV